MRYILTILLALLLSVPFAQDTKVKFLPKKTFKHFPAKLVNVVTLHKVNVNSTETSRMYRTRIRGDYKKNGLNFAGHYSFIQWGCGSPCQMSAIVDILTGKVYDGPTAAKGYEFNKDSRMIIVNPPDKDGYYYASDYYPAPEIWVWNEAKRKFVQYQ